MESDACIWLYFYAEETEVWEDLGEDDEWFLQEGCATTRETTTTTGALVVWLVNLIAHIQRKHYIPDAAVSLLLKVLSIFFIILGRFHPELLDIAKTFPTTIYALQKLLGVQKDIFVRYVTCPNCSAIYRKI